MALGETLSAGLVDAYLARIGHAGGRAPTRENLAALQKAHLLSVPYENLNAYFNRPSTLALDVLYDQIVTRRRGGYCFELNGLFAPLLRALGYSVREFFARWIDGEKDAVPVRRHRILRVDFQDGKPPLLVDAGMGQSAPLTPLRYAPGLQARPEAVYEIRREDGFGFVLVQHDAEGEKRLYSWDEAPQTPRDFDGTHYMLTHSEDSPFRKTLLVHLRTGEDAANSAFSAVDPQTGKEGFFFMRRRKREREVLRLPREKLTVALQREFGISYEPPA